MPGEVWIPVVGREARIRNDFLAHVDTEIAKNNSLDAVTDARTVEFQRGVVSGLRLLRARITEFKEKE